mmetsp:Transcript_21226/g.49184  ORF Transcript_21226/g.49184 Transcript_21226/m.49184 type:complete len:200 (-) Transcript_21226:293-892(-)
MPSSTCLAASARHSTAFFSSSISLARNRSRAARSFSRSFWSLSFASLAACWDASCISIRHLVEASSAMRSRSIVRIRAISASASWRHRASHRAWNCSMRSSIAMRSPNGSYFGLQACSFASRPCPTPSSSVCIPCVVTVGLAREDNSKNSCSSRGPEPSSMEHAEKAGTRVTDRTCPISSLERTSSDCNPHSGKSTDRA